MGIDSENWFLAKLRSDYGNDFSNLVHITNYNKRRKKLAYWVGQVNSRLAAKLNGGEGVFMVDSIPVHVCKLAREQHLRVCKPDFETAPIKATVLYVSSIILVINFIFILLIGMNGVYQSMETTKASVHDVHYLNGVKHSGINSCWQTRAIYRPSGSWIYSHPQTLNWKPLEKAIKKTFGHGHAFLKQHADESRLSFRNYVTR